MMIMVKLKLSSLQRNGPTGTVKLHFMKQYNKFTDIDYAHAEMS